TRLILVFLAIYPLLLYVIKRKALSNSFVFIVFFLILFFVYPIYSIIVDSFSELISIRYEDNRDASFGLRSHLYNLVEKDFFSGSAWDMLFGKGNEHSRLLVYNEMQQDVFPHNDFMRILNDWGIVGGSIFFFYLYR